MSDKDMGDTIRGQWAEYERIVLDRNSVPIGEIQRTETRRAFYAGCQAMMYLVVHSAEQPEDQAVDIMKALNEEMERWLTLLQAGAV